MTILPNKNGGEDGTAVRIANAVAAQAGLPVVPITVINNFIFNDKLANVTEAIILDFCELGWDWDYQKSGTHFFGVNTENFPVFQSEEWQKFDKWVSRLSKKIYFKRELLVGDKPKYVYPIDYPCWYFVPEVEPISEFNKRPIDIFFFWGRSHEGRLQLHSDIWSGAIKFGYSVCDNIHYFERFLNNESGRKLASMNIPHYCREDISTIFAIQQHAKISIAYPGAGFKTFRATGESIFNSIVAMPENNFVHSFPFIDGINCFKWDADEPALDRLLSCAETEQNYLYDIYKNGNRLAKRYQIDNYIKDYIIPIVAK